MRNWDAGVRENIDELAAEHSNVFLCGDFNSRIGEVNELSEQYYDRNSAYYASASVNSSVTKRLSKDKQVNCFGRKLINICKNVTFGLTVAPCGCALCYLFTF